MPIQKNAQRKNMKIVSYILLILLLAVWSCFGQTATVPEYTAKFDALRATYEAELNRLTSQYVAALNRLNNETRDPQVKAMIDVQAKNAEAKMGTAKAISARKDWYSGIWQMYTPDGRELNHGVQITDSTFSMFSMSSNKPRGEIANIVKVGDTKLSASIGTYGYEITRLGKDRIKIRVRMANGGSDEMHGTYVKGEQ